MLAIINAMINPCRQQIAKNAIMLTIRMVLVTIVGLYTSRVVLSALGIDDYGIYGVIGGVVGMASFLNTSMAGATSRFITFELGRGATDCLGKIFSSALIVHIILSLIVLFLAETIGLWFVNFKMNFPPERMFAVNILYQFTIISMIVNFTQVPYTALIIAYEKMNTYAYFEIVNVFFKLGIVYVLIIVNTDKLILYSALTLVLSTGFALAYRYYCKKHMPHIRFSLKMNLGQMREMLVFSGFDLYGNMCVVAKSQGQPLILNIFFGVIANAGAAIATTVCGVVKGFTTSVMQAFSPRITKLYAAGDNEAMCGIMVQSVQFSLFAFSLIAIPMFILAPFVLEIWLGQLPPYSIEFLRLMLIAILFDIFIRINNTAIHATGMIKNISFISGSFFLISPVLSWCLLKFWVHEAYVIYLIDIVVFIVVAALGFLFINRQIPTFNVKRYVVKSFRSLASVLLSYVMVFIAGSQLELLIVTNSVGTKLFIIVVIAGLTAIVLTLTTIFISFNYKDRSALFTIVSDKLSKISFKI